MSEHPLHHWARLRVSGEGDGVLEVPSIDSGLPTGFGNVRFAIGEKSQPRLLVPVGPGERAMNLPSTSKLVVTVAHFQVSGRKTPFLDVMSLDRSLDGVFAELAEEVLRRIEAGHAPLQSVTHTIQDFRELLKEEPRAPVPLSKVLGLVGELWVLSQMTPHSRAAVTAWVGPFEQRHDFRRGLRAIEVKTSGRSDATRISIHGIDQLEPPTGGQLLLVHVRAERNKGGDLSVAALWHHLLAAGTDDDELLRRLAANGCEDPLNPEWNAVSFSIHDHSAYTVEPGFPRISSGSLPGGQLPRGVSSLQYEVDLSLADRYKLSPPDLEPLWKEMAG